MERDAIQRIITKIRLRVKLHRIKAKEVKGKESLMHNSKAEAYANCLILISKCYAETIESLCTI
jgi:hypothetical protein